MVRTVMDRSPPWRVTAAALAAWLGFAAPPAVRPACAHGSLEFLAVTHGVACGDVTESGAVVWARCAGRARMLVECGTNPRFEHPVRGDSLVVTALTDFAGHAELRGLAPDTRYHYRVWFETLAGAGEHVHRGESASGSFRTAPPRAAARPVTFVWSADVGGHGWCRDVARGYAIFDAIRAVAPDFFLASGDMIYADATCPEEGPEGRRNVPGDFADVADSTVDWTDAPAMRAIFNRHWRYNRADPSLQAFLREVPMISQWDDHEVVNDFGGNWTHWNAHTAARAGYPTLVDAGRQAFFNWSPIARNDEEPGRIYRAFSWGRDLDLFVLDARSYRSRNDLPDTPENAKTLLGEAQRRWLLEGLAASRATWKVVANDVPMVCPTGSNAAVLGHDGWAAAPAEDPAKATGFMRELRAILRELDARDVRNVVFVTADVHSAQVIRYETDADGDGDTILFHELIAGPLSAFRWWPQEFDPTFSPRSLYGEGKIFNFGVVRIEPDAAGRALFKIEHRDETGGVRPGSSIVLEPR